MRLITWCALAGLILGVVGGVAWNRRPYTSVAMIRISQPFLTANVNPVNVMPADKFINDILQTELSRGNLSDKITLWNLYADERRRMPMEDVVELFRQNLHLDFMNDRQIRLSFTYSDRTVAQKITADLVGRILTNWVRQRTTQTILSSQFAKRQALQAGSEYEDAIAQARAAKAGPAADRLRLDAELARRRYELATEKAAEAHLLEQVEKMQMGLILEVLDPASLPAENGPSTAIIGMIGFGAGTLIGWLAWLLRRRPSTMELPTPASIP